MTTLASTKGLNPLFRGHDFHKLVEGFYGIITMHLIYFLTCVGVKKKVVFFFFIKLTYFACLAFRPYDNGKVINFKILILLS